MMSDDALALLVAEVLVHAVQVLPDLRKAPILCDLQLYGNLHVGGRGDANVYAALPLYYPSGCEEHLAADLPLYLLPAEVAHAEVPELLPAPESIPHVVKIPRGHDEHLLVAEIDHLGIPRGRLKDLLELFDVGVELFLQFEVVGDGLVGLVVGGEGEEVLEGVQLALLVAVQLQRVGRVRLGTACLRGYLKDASQLRHLLPEELEVRVLLADHVRELLLALPPLFLAVRDRL